MKKYWQPSVLLLLVEATPSSRRAYDKKKSHVALFTN